MTEDHAAVSENAPCPVLPTLRIFPCFPSSLCCLALWQIVESTFDSTHIRYCPRIAIAAEFQLANAPISPFLVDTLLYLLRADRRKRLRTTFLALLVHCV